jgi:hypothetical protein
MEGDGDGEMDVQLIWLLSFGFIVLLLLAFFVV